MTFVISVRPCARQRRVNLRSSEVFLCNCVSYCRMLLTHCMMGWMVLTVLSLCLPAWSAVEVIQPYRVAGTNGTAQVQCFIHPRPSYHQLQPSHDQSLPSYPYRDPEELRVTLLRGLHGTQQLCSSVLGLKGEIETGAVKEGEVQCSAQVREGAVEVTVSGLKAADTDLYRCQIEVLYPPPYLRLTGNGTLLHVSDSPGCPVQEAQRQTADHGDDGEGDGRTAPVSVPVVVLMILVTFVLLLIIYLQVLQCERGRPGVLHKTDAAAFSC